MWGLVDRRFARQRSAAGRVDERAVEAIRQAVTEEAERSTGTVRVSVRASSTEASTAFVVGRSTAAGMVPGRDIAQAGQLHAGDDAIVQLHQHVQ